MLNALQQAREGQKGREGAGRTKGTAQNEKISAENDCTITPEEFEALALRVSEVERRYFEDNERLGAFFTDYAKDKAARGQRFSIQERAEWLRWHRPSDSYGVDAKVNNSDMSILSRLVAERVPECVGLLEQRSSRYDVVFGERGNSGT